MALRSFLYLDNEAVDDFLSQVEGGIVEGAYSEKDTMTSGKEGALSIKVPGTGIGASGKGNKASSIEIQRQIRDNPQAKFARLYELLTDEHMLDEEDRVSVLNGFDLKVYDGIRVGEIIEVRGVGTLPEWEHFKQAVADLQATVGLMKAFGQDPTADPQSQMILNQMAQLSSISSGENTIVSVTPIGAPNIKIVAKLDVTKLRRPKAALETEVTILGKVQRRLEKNEKIDVFRLLPHLKGFEHLFKKAAQQTKGPRGRIERPKTDTPLDEYINYPAVEVLPVAVYQ